MARYRLTKTGQGRLVAALLILASLLVTVWLGIRSANKEAPPSGVESALLVVLAGVLQVGGGATVSKVGRADPGHARSSVRRLLQIVRRTSEARAQVEAAFEDHTPAKGKQVLGQLSVHLSYIEDAAVLGVEDWAEFHGDAVWGIVDGEGSAESRSSRDG